MATLHPFLDTPRPLAISHRGGAGDHPENTLAAFEAAIGAGFRYVETDVHATSDGVLVAFHDPGLDRVTDRGGRIAELTWNEVKPARVAGTEPICRIEELLDAFPTTRVNIDPKADAAVEPLAAVLRRPGVLDRVCVGSFSDARITWLRTDLGTRLCTSAGPKETARIVAAGWGVPLGHLEARCLQVPPTFRGTDIVTPRLLDTAARHGLQVHVWTIDEPDEMRSLLDLGVDGIMTDRNLVLRSVLMERGQWHPAAESDTATKRGSDDTATKRGSDTDG